MPEVGSNPLGEILSSFDTGQNKTASSDEEEAEIDPLFKGAEADREVVKTASELAQKGRQIARQKVANVAAERQKIAEEIGRDGLEDLDKLADLDQVGRQLAHKAVREKQAEAQHQEKVAETYNAIEDEYGEETADDLAKFAFYDQVGRNLAVQAVAELAGDE